MEQLLAHLWGDYLLQSDWMANLKRQAWRPAIAHAGLYSIAFIWLTSSPLAWVVIFGTHLLIDRFGLARYLVWAKNWLGPVGLYAEVDEHHPDHPLHSRRWIAKTPLHEMQSGGLFDWKRMPWKACEATGYPPDRPVWLAVWLTIVADNTLHLTINYLALRYL